MGWNPVKEAEKQAKRAVDKIVKPAANAAAKTANRAIDKASDAAESSVRSVAKKAARSVASVADTAEDSLKSVAKQAERSLDEAAHDIKEDLSKVGHDIEDGLTDKLPELFENLIDELAESVAKEGLQKTQEIIKVSHRELEKLESNKPDLVDAINELGGTIELGPMTLAYSGFYSRMEGLIGVLDHYINEPPSIRRRDIIAMIEALGPDSVDLGISIQIVAVVVGSKELGVGGGLNDISIALFSEIADAILEAAGVPE